MGHLQQIVIAVLVLAVAVPAFGRYYWIDDGQPQFGDLTMMASSRHSSRQPAGGAEVDAEVAASGDRVRRGHHQGVTGPVHTFVKTDKHAHFKWGVRHHVGHEFAG